MVKSIKNPMSLRKMRNKTLAAWTSLLLVGAASSPAIAAGNELTARNLSFTTFNIEWFGLNGDISGHQGDEERTAAIRAHLDSNKAWADVMAFEEVVDVELLQAELVPNNYRCASYDNSDPKHQHVVLCVRSPLRLEIATDDDNYALEEVALGHHRPAVHGIITTANGQKLAHVLAVHLKAMPNESLKRRTQIGHISDYLSKRQDKLPLVLLGDFNTFNTDITDFNHIFSNSELNLHLVSQNGAYTWRRGGSARGSSFDHFWISGGVTPLQPAKVIGPCNYPQSRSAEILAYNRAISDHCAVYANFRL